MPSTQQPNAWYPQWITGGILASGVLMFVGSRSCSVKNWGIFRIGTIKYSKVYHFYRETVRHLLKPSGPNWSPRPQRWTHIGIFVAHLCWTCEADLSKRRKPENQLLLKEGIEFIKFLIVLSWWIFRKYPLEVLPIWFWCVILIGPIRGYGSNLLHCNKAIIHHQFQEFQGLVCWYIIFLCDFKHVWIICHNRDLQYIGIWKRNDINFGNAELTISGKLSYKEKGMVDFWALVSSWREAFFPVICIFILINPKKFMFQSWIFFIFFLFTN